MPELDEKSNRNDRLGAISHDNWSFQTRIINQRLMISQWEISRISKLPIQAIQDALSAFRDQDGQHDTVYFNTESNTFWADDVAFYSLCCQMPFAFDESVQMAVLMALDHFRFDPQAQAVGGES